MRSSITATSRSILKHILGIQSDARTQSFCCLPSTWAMPTPLYICCHVSMNLKHFSLIKTWISETCVFHPRAYLLPRADHECYKTTENSLEACVSRYFYSLMETQVNTTGSYGKFQILFLTALDWWQGEKEKRIRRTLSLPQLEWFVCYEMYVFKLP